ncbi:MAG TPA: single-stranded DNA-binding protein [Candidatus Bathyarchaeia archaeon]|nr:single-stranded DNA-binding protein [Candidatus Bathyarchaeia archaeon]
MASRSLNKVMLIGNLTRDPELRYTPQGTAVCTFGLATNRYWQPSGGGEKQEEAEFHRIVCWQKLAELCAQLLFKGRKAFVEGRLQTRNWTGKDGQERITTEVVIDNMIVLDSRRKPGEEGMGVTEEGRGAPAIQPSAKKVTDDVQVNTTDQSKEKKEEKPAPVKTSSNKAVQETTDKEEVKADDIPF